MCPVSMISRADITKVKCHVMTFVYSFLLRPLGHAIDSLLLKKNQRDARGCCRRLLGRVGRANVKWFLDERTLNITWKSERFGSFGCVWSHFGRTKVYRQMVKHVHIKRINEA